MQRFLALFLMLVLVSIVGCSILINETRFIDTSEPAQVSTPMQSAEQIESSSEIKYTQKQLVNAKWDALACAMELYHQYGITPQEADEGVNILREDPQDSANVREILRYMWKCRSDYNENSVTDPLPESDGKLLEIVMDWSEEDYISFYNEEWYQIFGE